MSFPNYQVEIQCNHKESRANNFVIKSLVILFLSVPFLFYKFTFYLDFTRQCIYDYLHDITYPINRWMEKDSFSTVILIGQVPIDFFATTLLLSWMAFMKNIYMPNFILVFYIIRTLVLKVAYFPFPDDIVWRKTPIPSVMVPYDHTRDFYFSGHTGLAIMATMEVIRLKFPKWTHYLGYFTIAWMPFMLIISRVHYTIDVLASPFFVRLSYDIHQKFKRQLDFLWSLPYIICIKVKDFFCPREEQDNKLFDDHLP